MCLCIIFRLSQHSAGDTSRDLGYLKGPRHLQKRGGETWGILRCKSVSNCSPTRTNRSYSCQYTFEVPLLCQAPPTCRDIQKTRSSALLKQIPGPRLAQHITRIELYLVKLVSNQYLVSFSQIPVFRFRFNFSAEIHHKEAPDASFRAGKSPNRILSVPENP